LKKRQGIIFGVVFIFILFAAIVFFMKNQEFDEPVSKSDFKLNTVVTVTIYDLEGKKAEAIMKSAQMTLENHVSKQFDPEDLGDDTLVLTIEENEKYKILSEYGHKGNVYTLNEFVGRGGEIPNPYGKPLTAYGECYEMLSSLIKELAEKLNYIAEEEK